MKLVPLSNEDIDLYIEMFSDPVYMVDLGGPQPLEKIPRILEKQIQCNNSKTGLVLKIVPEEDDWQIAKQRWEARTSGENVEGKTFFAYNDPDNRTKWMKGIGSLCLWKGEHNGQSINEIGYGVLPTYQNYGFTSTAVKLLLEIARNDFDDRSGDEEAGSTKKSRWQEIHIFTSISNAASNKLCTKLGFEWLEACNMDYDGRDIPANHYKIVL
jgi:RimJ/RimL family protein N-acetyltransferase